MTTRPSAGAGPGMASLQSSRSCVAHDQLKTKGPVLPVSWPCAAMYQREDWSALGRAGFFSSKVRFIPRDLGAVTNSEVYLAGRSGVRSFSHSHRRAGFLPLLHRSGVRERSLHVSRIHSLLQRRSCRTLAAQSRPHQCLCQITAGLVHLSQRPFQSRLTCWFNRCQQARTNSCHSVTRGAA
jgi:hypothetical protein